MPVVLALDPNVESVICHTDPTFATLNPGGTATPVRTQSMITFSLRTASVSSRIWRTSCLSGPPFVPITVRTVYWMLQPARFCDAGSVPSVGSYTPHDGTPATVI